MLSLAGGGNVVGRSVVSASATAATAVAPVSRQQSSGGGNSASSANSRNDSHDVSRRAVEEFPSLSVPMATPTFSYALSSTTKYHVLLDQTRVMGERDRWTNVKRALFRFIDLVPIGSQLNIITFGLAANEVLPTTTVTENNRDGVFGRIPRRILDDQEACVICAFQKILPGVGSNEVVLLITGSDRRMADHDSVLTDVEEKNLPVYVVSYPATVDPSNMVILVDM